ncbi:MAG TPA: choice-of-anchor Q domain-containing protein, partial [Candidatus Angelobacter sp.]|nr:choice-of-anchor Q domain-containing protein [Candidatus Angelobacter sp.]
CFNANGGTPPVFLVGSLVSNPLFLDLGLRNFHLQSGSTAKNAGVTISSANTYNNFTPWNGNPLDNDGVARPQTPGYDIGSYQFFTGSDSRPNPPVNPSATGH